MYVNKQIEMCLSRSFHGANLILNFVHIVTVHPVNTMNIEIVGDFGD